MKPALRKPKRWISLLIYPAALLSLLIVVAAAYMWTRSHFIAERWGWGTLSHDGKDKRLVDITFWSAQGGVGMYRIDYVNLLRTNFGWPVYHDTNAMTMYPYIAISAKGIPETRWRLGDFAYCHTLMDREIINADEVDHGDRAISTSVVAPWWSFCALGAVLPLIATRRLIRTRRWRKQTRAGLCTNCGYDLRATPEKCPECGTIPKIKTA